MSNTVADSPLADPKDSGTDIDPLAGMLCFSVYTAGLAFNRAYKPKLDALGITYLQYMALLLLRHRSAQSIKELGERLSLDSNTLTPLIKRLEAAGFVKRRRDSEDERIVRVDLTPAGEKVVEEAICVSKELGGKLKITPEHFKALQNLMEQLGHPIEPPRNL
ncbi:MarR family transcriptional regulator [Rhodoblastus sp.]|jgi:DNA-binding MarR family transcriptional regulator|uniref:MarR family winged helix-turn-helix transcriptional regulator n=1 Tax=Rhodoblastus sp. TaxID=1962975 RepID=UPI0025F0B623|nr:MarR family transcriptional regulator [Rhodoblastus sp.]